MNDKPTEGGEFDPATHTLAQTRYFDELEVGEKYRNPSRTLGDGNFTAFQSASMDNHPIHYDLEYCKSQGHPELLAHGLQVLIQGVAGAGMFPHVIGAALVGFLEQSSRFLKPVYRGDTVYPMLQISELIAQRTTGVVVMRLTIHNQRGELVLEGEHRYLVRKRNP